MVPTTTAEAGRADRLLAVPAADFAADNKEGASILPRAAARARPPPLLLPAVTIAVASIGAIIAA